MAMVTKAWTVVSWLSRVITGHRPRESFLIILWLIPHTHDIDRNAPSLCANNLEEMINVCMETTPNYLC